MTTPLDILGISTEDKAAMRASIAEGFAGKSADYIDGYVAGVRDHAETMQQELLTSLLASLPVAVYAQELRAETDNSEEIPGQGKLFDA